MSEFNVAVAIVPPSDENFDKVKQAATHSRSVKIDFNALAEQYNAAEVGAVLLISVPKTYRAGNFGKVFAGPGRGLTEGEDFTALRITRDENGNSLPMGKRPVAVTKLTAKKMGII